MLTVRIAANDIQFARQVCGLLEHPAIPTSPRCTPVAEGVIFNIEIDDSSVVKYGVTCYVGNQYHWGDSFSTFEDMCANIDGIIDSLEMDLD